jgi:hypothetical protein
MQRRYDGLLAWLAAGLSALALGCAGGSMAPAPGEPAVAALPTLVIDCDPAALDSGAGTPIDARLQLGAERAGAKVSFAAGAGAGRPPEIFVDIKGKSRFFRMRRFSLFEPAALGFQQGLLVLRHLQREGVLAPRTLLAHLTLNGSPRGVMVVEEGFSKELPESQQRREGVQFRLQAKALPVARLVAYGSKKVAEEPQLARERDTALGLFGAFVHGDLPAADVFDVALMGRFLAVAELWQVESMLRPANLRFYFDPVTQRLEPIGFSGRPQRPDGEPFQLLSGEGWPAQLLADASVRLAFEENLRRLVSELRNGALAGWVSEVEASMLAALRPELPDLGPLDLAPWSARAAALPALIARERATTGRSLTAAPDVPRLMNNPIPSASLAEVTARHPFLQFEAERALLRSAPGVWEVAGSLVVPEGIGLLLTAGTTLRFAEGEMLVASGPLRFLGEPERPVVLSGRERAGVEGVWAGLVSLSSPEPHEWRNVVVRNTAGVDHNGWRLTGGVTVRAAEIRIVDSSFDNNRAEDALNLIRSRFTFRGISITTAASDAFDCDFCEGRIVAGRIADIGGDGVDVSGSVVELDGMTFEQIRDKAISVGERSRLVARRVRIDGVGTALASKDGSEATFADSDVSGVGHVAIMAYTKKKEYGPGRVVVRNVRMPGVERRAVAQLGSWIEIDGVVQPEEEVDVDELYERGYMKK